jgi:hypothetical protein
MDNLGRGGGWSIYRNIGSVDNRHEPAEPSEAMLEAGYVDMSGEERRGRATTIFH